MCMGQLVQESFGMSQEALNDPDIAIKIKHKVELLLAHGANPNYMDGRGWIPLHQAVDQGHAGVAQMLINAGANLNARISGVGYTPLDWAYHRQWPELVERIRKHGGKTGEELEAEGK